MPTELLPCPIFLLEHVNVTVNVTSSPGAILCPSVKPVTWTLVVYLFVLV